MDQDEKGGMSSTHVILIILGALGLGVVICAGVIVVCLVAITALGTSAMRRLERWEQESTPTVPSQTPCIS